MEEYIGSAANNKCLSVSEVNHSKQDELLKVSKDIETLNKCACHSIKIDSKNESIVFFGIRKGKSCDYELTFEEIKNKYGIDMYE